jgi:hypothetical protein
MAQCDDIEAILYEAYAYGIRREVIETADQLKRANKFMDTVHAYEQAFRLHVPKEDLNKLR